MTTAGRSRPRRPRAPGEPGQGCLGGVRRGRQADAPPTLRKGRRGGGRDRDKMIDHVLGADHAYALRVAASSSRPARSTIARAVLVERHAVLEVLGEPSDGSPLAGRKWPQRYAARRIAWHALDHAWEMEDRTDPLTDRRPHRSPRRRGTSGSERRVGVFASEAPRRAPCRGPG